MEARPVAQDQKKKEIKVIRRFSGEKSPEEILVELIKAHTEK